MISLFRNGDRSASREKLRWSVVLPCGSTTLRQEPSTWREPDNGAWDLSSYRLWTGSVKQPHRQPTQARLNHLCAVWEVSVTKRQVDLQDPPCCKLKPGQTYGIKMNSNDSSKCHLNAKYCPSLSICLNYSPSPSNYHLSKWAGGKTWWCGAAIDVQTRRFHVSLFPSSSNNIDIDWRWFMVTHYSWLVGT